MHIPTAVFYLRVAGHVVALRSPRCRPLFSERYRRGVKVIPLGLGWRVTVRKITDPQGAHHE